MNHAVNATGKWIFDSNDYKAFSLAIESLNLICACSDEEEYFEIFQEVFYFVRYANPKEKSNHVQKCFDIIINIYIYICQNDGSHNKRILDIQKIKKQKSQRYIITHIYYHFLKVKRMIINNIIKLLTYIIYSNLSSTLVLILN